MNTTDIKQKLTDSKTNLSNLVKKVSASGGDTTDYDKEIVKINTVLDKIEQGNYEKCSDCGSDLSSAILEMIPYTTHCRDCV